MTRYDALPRGHMVASRFVVEGLIGRGRTSAVYKAFDGQTNTHVALKILDPFLAQDPTSVERFTREVRIIRSLDHPSIVKVYEFLRDGDSYVMCMELVDGLDGKARAARFGRMPIADFLVVAKGVLAALEACHRVKVLHRDLKPQNILITADNRVKLVDFGISRVNTMSDLTKTGTILGTADYMAPELFLSTRADPRSDIYAAGAVLYELLAERPPHVASSLSMLMTRHQRAEIEPLSSIRGDVPRWLEAIVSKCLRVDPNARYQSCWELLRDLERGERAFAAREDSEATAPCLECKRLAIPGLPFCHHCGTFNRDLYVRGPYSLVLYQCDDKKRFAAEVRRMIPSRSMEAVAHRLARPPVVVFGGVSQATASALFDELGRLPCELRITRNLANEVRLPRLYLGLAVLALLPLLVLKSVLGRLGVTLAGELALAGFYLWQMRPLIALREARGRAATPGDTELIVIAGKLRTLTDEALKTILGNVVRSYVRVRDGTGTAATILGAKDLAPVVARALEAARRVEDYGSYLADTSVNTIKARLEAAGRRLEEAEDVAAAEPLVEARTKLRRELADYRMIEELQSRTFISLLNLQTLLRRVEAAAREEGAGDAIRAELEALRAEFGAEAPQASAARPL
jgi:hypothetical protein